MLVGGASDAAGGRRKGLKQSSLRQRQELSPNMEGWLHTELRIVSVRERKTMESLSPVSDLSSRAMQEQIFSLLTFGSIE